jgi:fido (protein-threonine AMPylation protein)
MSDPLDGTDEAATPLTEEEREELIPTYITLRSELNEAEQANILAAQKWAFTRKRDILDERFLTQLHKHMFGQVWRWAGNFRRTARSTSMHYAPLIDMTSRLYCFL